MYTLRSLFWSPRQDMDNPIDPRIKWLNRFSIIGHILLAYILVLLIEVMSRRSLSEAIGFLTGSPQVFFYNAFLIFVCLLFAYAFRHRTVVRIAVSVVWLALGAVNGVILSQRVTPFNFTDMHMIGDLLLMQNSKYFSLWQEILVVVAIVAFVILCVYLYLKGPKYRGAISRLGCLALAVLVFALTPVVMKSAIHAGVMAGYFGNLAQGYKDYGFTYSFACSAFDTGISADDEYSEEVIAGISNNIQVPETEELPEGWQRPNIIMIQLETFVDPYDFTFLSYNEDPTPNFHRLKEEFGSGAFTVPVVGAGTCNTEFECLTGMGCQFFGIGEYPYKTILKETTCESGATALREVGYRSTVIHNNTASFYGRHNIFSRMGFDAFTSKELMDATTYNEFGTWLTDDILTEETEKALDASVDQQDFIYEITVQSHGAYPTYELLKDPEIQVSGDFKDKEEYWQYQYYINELHEVDAYIGELIEMLEQRDEPTIVMMYGDHLPTMGLTEDQMLTGNLYNTSYVTWNNFGLQVPDQDLSAYQALAYLTNCIGIHEGTMFRWQQYALNNDLAGTEGFRIAWRMMQYDLLYGEHYLYGGEEKDWSNPLTFGVQDVEIESAELNEQTGEYIIHGKNFTPWSKVNVNDEKVTTEYIDCNTLRVWADELVDDAKISVNQMCGSLVLRYSNSITFTAPERFEDIQARATQYAEQMKAQQAEEEARQAAEAAAAEKAEEDEDRAAIAAAKAAAKQNANNR